MASSVTDGTPYDRPQAHAATFRLPYTAPFDWGWHCAYLAARAIPSVESVTGACYARTIRVGADFGTLSVLPGADDALVATIRLPQPIPDLASRIAGIFDLAANPGVIAAALSVDPFMAALVAARPGLRVPGAWDGFELAVRAILGQQVSVAAATRLAGPLVAAFGTRLAGEARGPALSQSFAAPDALVEADVSPALNMPRARGAAIRALAAAALAEPDLFAPGHGIVASVERLKRLRCVGHWTAQYIAMRGRRDAERRYRPSVRARRRPRPPECPRAGGPLGAVASVAGLRGDASVGA